MCFCVCIVFIIIFTKLGLLSGQNIFSSFSLIIDFSLIQYIPTSVFLPFTPPRIPPPLLTFKTHRTIFNKLQWCISNTV